MLSINFRCNDDDEKVMALIRQQHPITCSSDAAVLRKALEGYWFSHGPDKGRGKTALLAQIDERLRAIERILATPANTLEAARAAGCDCVDKFDEKGMDR